jgi:CHAT domain-containing protein
MPRKPREDNFGEMMKLTFEGRAALAAGEPIKALELLRKKHALVLQRFGKNSVFAATSGVDLGEALLGCGQYAEAGQLLAWSATRYRELDTNDERALRALGAAAMAAYQAADYQSAEAQYKVLITDLETRGEKFQLFRAAEQDHLAQVLLRQNRFSEAEPLLVEALSVFERAASDEESTAICLSLLGKLYFQTGRFREAEAASRRALSVLERTAGENSIHVAKELDHLAMSLAMRAQSERKRELAAEAVSLGERAVKILAEQLPPSHPSVYGAHRNLSGYRNLSSSIGLMYPSNKDLSESEKETVPVEPRLPKAHPDSIQRLVSSAMDAAMHGDYNSAQAAIKQAARIAVGAFGNESLIAHHVRATDIQILRRHCSFLLGEPTGELSPLEHLNMQMRAHLRRGKAEDENASLPPLTPDVQTEVRNLIAKALQALDTLVASAVSEDGTRKPGAAGTQWVGGTHVGDVLEVIHYARLLGLLSPADACNKANLAMQLHGWHSAAEAFGASIGRDVTTAEQREYRTLALEYETLVERMVQRAMGRASSTDRDVQLIEETHSRIEEFRRRLGSNIASSRESATGQVLSLSTIQAHLNKQEAVVSYLIGTRAIFIIAVTARQYGFVRVEFEEGLLVAQCDSLQESVKFDAPTGSPAAFDLPRAISLYGLLIQPLEKYLDGVSHLLLIPDGPLWSISFEALLRDLSPEETEEARTTEADDKSDNTSVQFRRMRQALELEQSDDPCSSLSGTDAWLGSRYALSVLPALSVLSHRGRTRNDMRLTKSFIGFGNPLLCSQPSGEPESGTGIAVPEGSAASFLPLPETERLLDEVARILGADPELDVIVRADASVRRVLELNEEGELANRRIVCFATHAVYPTSEGDTLQEPGLILASLEGARPGVLSASEIRQLRLNADFILLTACFTGAPSGKSINSPLSGLAQAFFTAGARCLLVSHWPVDLDATEALIAALFSGGPAEESLAAALQRAAHTIRTDVRRRDFSHPVYWAGFSVVGDGGASLRSI